MVAEHGNAGRTNRTDRGAVVLDLLVGALEPDHREVVEPHRDVLDGLELESVGLGLFHEGTDVGDVPARLTGQERVVQLDAAQSELCGVTELLVRQFVELSERDTDRHDRFS